jgi:hypothetical protein
MAKLGPAKLERNGDGRIVIDDAREMLRRSVPRTT